MRLIKYVKGADYLQELDTARAAGAHEMLRIEGTAVHSRRTCRNTFILCTMTLLLFLKALLLCLADSSNPNPHRVCACEGGGVCMMCPSR